MLLHLLHLRTLFKLSAYGLIGGAFLLWRHRKAERRGLFHSAEHVASARVLGLHAQPLHLALIYQRSSLPAIAAFVRSAVSRATAPERLRIHVVYDMGQLQSAGRHVQGRVKTAWELAMSHAAQREPELERILPHVQLHIVAGSSGVSLQSLPESVRTGSLVVWDRSQAELARPWSLAQGWDTAAELALKLQAVQSHSLTPLFLTPDAATLRAAIAARSVQQLPDFVQLVQRQQ